MLIAQLEPLHLTQGGDWYYRCHLPGHALAEQAGVHVVNLRSTHSARDDLFQQADVVVLNMLCDPDLFPLITDRSQRQQPTLFELNDDISALSPHSPTAGFYRVSEHQTLFRMLVRACSAVQFSTRELERLYGRFAVRSAVFENQLAPELVPTKHAERGEGPVVVGWGGSAGHYQDLAAIAAPLVDWFSRRNNVVLHVMANDSIWSLFDGLSSDKKRRTLPGSIDEYHRFVSGLDIGIAPLQDVAFNRCRSDVKFLEYALHGVVPLLQNAPAYRASIQPGITGFYFDSVQELLSTLDQLLENPSRLRSVGTQAQAYVMGERNERTHASRRLDFYRSLLPAEGSSQTLAWLEQRFASLPTVRQDRLWTLEPSECERLMHDALILGQQDQKRQQAATLLNHAAKLEPRNYLPHLYGAAFSPNPIDCLERALEINPRSIQARLALSEHLFRAKAIAPALNQLMSAAELYPSYDIPYVRLAQFMSALGKTAEADHFAQAAARLRAPFRELNSQ